MQVNTLPTKERIQVILEQKGESLVCKCENFLFGIFSYSDKLGNMLFVAPSDKVDFYVTTELAKELNLKVRKPKKRNVIADFYLAR